MGEARGRRFGVAWVASRPIGDAEKAQERDGRRQGGVPAQSSARTTAFVGLGCARCSLKSRGDGPASGGVLSSLFGRSWHAFFPKNQWVVSRAMQVLVRKGRDNGTKERVCSRRSCGPSRMHCNWRWSSHVHHGLVWVLGLVLCHRLEGGAGERPGPGCRRCPRRRLGTACPS